MAHQKTPIVIHDYRGFLIIRFGMRTLQAASKALVSILLAQLAPSEARISISRTGHQKQKRYCQSSTFSVFVDMYSESEPRQVPKGLGIVCARLPWVQFFMGACRGSDSRTGHQKIPIVIHDYRGFLIIRFGKRTLQAASKALVSILVAQLAPSEARISISHQFPQMSHGNDPLRRYRPSKSPRQKP